jgi:sulfur-carrier protein adenylyltransferase/sulfurtransferase
MEGGMHAWNGFVASGPPEFGMAFFDSTADPRELIALAWLLEDGSGRFYAGISSFIRDQEASDLFMTLSGAENRHKASLVDLYREFSGKDPEPGFQDILSADDPKQDAMEGGMNVSEALKWAKDQDKKSILELSMALETNSYDLYIKMGRAFSEEKSRKVFDVLVSEEKRHLDKLADLLEKNL